ncbi:TonB-dependent receptor [uncultured Bacteroides sp.]|uniref:SusC/RagA family TonB-linked outer membrane protein n=1 Tax=uncultured Bacteroides sp. TaxID=162156 RepID=UPI0025D34B2F|nr:TonB-dependent receptor [uncultured Bacteroides sp.]
MKTGFQDYLKWKRAFSILLLTLVAVTGAVAQSLVRGKVIDDTGLEVIGASILVKGTTQGTITDMDGMFSLSVPDKNAVLQVSYIGYQTLEVKVDITKPMSIVLKEDSEMLEEVVVVGYQEVKKKDLTGSVAKVDMDNLLNTPVGSFDQTLGGRVAGVNVSSGEGQPGGTMNIVIRGNNSLTQDNSPLYVIDGFPVEDATLASTINPSDIESLDILKDASATAIYGARGANGVVIITTKKGKVGKPQLKYDGSFGFQNITRQIPLMDAYEFVKLQSELYPSDALRYYLTLNDVYGQPIKDEATGQNIVYDLDYYKTAPQYYWQDEIFRTAWQQSHNVSLMGGSEGIRYTASLSYFDQDGVVLESNYQRFQSRMNTNIRHGKWNASLTANYSRSVQTGSSTSLYSSSGMNNLFYSVWGYRPVNHLGKPLENLKNNGVDDALDMTNDYRFNPYMDLLNAYRKYYINNLQLNGYVAYDILKGLKLKISGGFTNDSRNSDQFNNSDSRYGSPISNDKVNATVTRMQRLTWLNENVLTYQTRVKKHHAINSLLGVTFQNSDYESYSFKTTNIPNESLGMAGMNEGIPSTTTSLKSSWSMMSYLARINYDYKSKYYATASFRADGSSKFSKKNRFGYFPSGSLAWTFTQEEFMKKMSKVLSNGKLRLSWGLTGNNRVGEYDYYDMLAMLKAKQGTYISNGSNSSTVYPFENNLNSVGIAPISILNEDLKWETTEQWNVGLDLDFFNERLGITVDWYLKTTRDLLLDAVLPQSTGFFSAMKNIGKIRNSGWELTLNTVNIQTKNFKWSSNFNIAFNKNKVLELAENQTALLTSAYFDQNYNAQPTYISKVGYPMGMMYGYIYEGTYKYDDFYNSGGTYTLRPDVPAYTGETNTQPGMPKYKDINGDGKIDSSDRTFIGSGQPIHTGGFTNDFSYKGFDLSIFFQWSYGNDILNANRLFFENVNGKKDLNQFASYADRWTPENPESDIPAATKSSSNQVVSSRVIEDGSFLRLKTVTLGYNIPTKYTKRWKIANARVYVAGQNLWTLSSYSGYDPEVSIRNSAITPGLDYSAYPRAYAINFGVSLGF